MNNLKSIIALSALALSMFSCQENLVDVKEGMVDYTIFAGLPNTISSYASDNGGIVNVNSDEYDLKYTMQVWTTGSNPELVYSSDLLKSDNFDESVSFNVRLAAREYNFVFFSEFVKDGESNFSYTGLDAITLLNRKYGDDAVDAYYACETINLGLASVAKSVTLTRPFGKIRLLATDKFAANVAEVQPAYAEITYADTNVPAVFSAVDGKVQAPSLTNSQKFVFDIVKENVTVAGQAMEAYVVGFDYILPHDSQRAYNFTVEIFDAAGNEIGHRLVSDIPVEKNKLTTVYGNFYSNEADLTVSVDDEFDEEEDIMVSVPLSVDTFDDLENLLSSMTEVPESMAVEIAGPVLTDDSFVIPAAFDHTAFDIVLKGEVASKITISSESYAAVVQLEALAVNGGELVVFLPKGDFVLGSGAWSGLDITTK